MIACICHNLSYTKINEKLKDGKTFKELVKEQMFGTQCKKCVSDIKKHMKKRG